MISMTGRKAPCRGAHVRGAQLLLSKVSIANDWNNSPWNQQARTIVPVRPMENTWISWLRVGEVHLGVTRVRGQQFLPVAGEMAVSHVTLRYRNKSPFSFTCLKSYCQVHEMSNFIPLYTSDAANQFATQVGGSSASLPSCCHCTVLEDSGQHYNVQLEPISRYASGRSEL
jgi:hypothetical protein